MLENYPDVLKVKDIQEILNIGKSAALRLLSKGGITCFKIGRCYKIPKKCVIDYIESMIK
jgi:excisionase family DNA binding protein